MKHLQKLARNPQIIFGSSFLILFLIGLNYLLPPAIDWTTLYRPAAAALANGQSPFSVDRFSNAPWVLLPMLPLLLVPESLGRAFLALSAMISLILIGRKFGAKPVGLAFFLLSPPVVSMLFDGNIDWLIALGFIMPPQIGLFFLVIKPQLGIAVIVFWLWQAWKKNGFREVFRVFLPVTIALGISFVVFGLWPLNFSRAFEWGGNASLWPVSLPVGLGLMAASILKQDLRYAISASPCFSPYLMFHSWIGPLIAILASTPILASAVIGLWILLAIRAF